jgi:hypothetical protein
VRLMLAAIFFFILLGLFARQIGRREQVIVAAVATLMTALYFSSMRFW